MARIIYDTAETLIYDPVTSNRGTTRSALYSIGFRRIETVATLKDFNDYIIRRPPDLAICEAQGAEAELSRVIQTLRQGTVAYNPFLVIIVTAWENKHSLVQQVINSGADDLILRPYSTALMENRIRLHVEKRKGFVITSEYVGPDRRHRERLGGTHVFVPPNSLKMKAKDRIPPDEAAQRLEAELELARDLLTTEKLRRDAFQICVLWRLLQDNSLTQSKFEAHRARLSEAVNAVSRRAANTDYDRAVEWCDALLEAIQGLDLGVDRNASTHLLGHAALSLNAIFADGRSRDESLAEIDEVISKIKARQIDPPLLRAGAA